MPHCLPSLSRGPEFQCRTNRNNFYRFPVPRCQALRCSIQHSIACADIVEEEQGNCNFILHFKGSISYIESPLLRRFLVAQQLYIPLRLYFFFLSLHGPWFAGFQTSLSQNNVNHSIPKQTYSINLDNQPKPTQQTKPNWI